MLGDGGKENEEVRLQRYKVLVMQNKDTLEVLQYSGTHFFLTTSITTVSHNKDGTLCSESIQLCTTLWDPVDCSPPDSSVHGIL